MGINASSTPSEKLDFYLKFISKSHAFTNARYSGDFLKAGTDSLYKTEAIYDHLVKDGYAVCTEKEFPGMKDLSGNLPTVKKYTITFSGQLFLEKGGYKTDDKRKALFRWAKRMEIFALCFGAVMAGLFSVWSYNHDTKVEYLEILNKALLERAQQWESQIDLYIDKSRRSYQKENELLMLRDSLRTSSLRSKGT